jgi:hypothetical protein
MRTITEMARENGAKGRTNQFLDNLRSEIARSGGYGTLFDPKREERIERARAAAQSARLRASWAHVEAAVLGHHPGRRLVFQERSVPGLLRAPMSAKCQPSVLTASAAPPKPILVSASCTSSRSTPALLQGELLSRQEPSAGKTRCPQQHRSGARSSLGLQFGQLRCRLHRRRHNSGLGPVQTPS